MLDQLRDRRFLLVLDNCEHLVDACAEFVHTVLAECPRTVVLTTSRQSLGIDGEQVLPVPPLAEDDRVRLFVDRASAVWPSFEVTAENHADVVRLCRQLDGIPLAIELAAARIRALSPPQLADRLTRSLALLTGGAGLGVRRVVRPRGCRVRVRGDRLGVGRD